MNWITEDADREFETDIIHFNLFCMKKIFSLLPLFAALVFTGCSSDEDVLDKKGNGSKEYGYVAVNIVQPKSIGPRALSDGFEYGNSDENRAETGLFFIFSTDGNTLYGDPQTLTLTTTAGTGNNPEVEEIYKSVLVIDGASEEPADLQIVCILNAPDGLGTGITSLSDLKAEIADYSASTPGAFIMSNSVYTGGLGATVDVSNIATSAADALANPVEIYVERVVAKVRAHSTSSFDNQGANPNVDGAEKSLSIRVTGIEIANIAQTSYLLKNIDGITYTWAWSDATNKRSYWETMPSDLACSNKSYNDIADTGFDIKNVNYTEYIQPNTSAQHTAVLVTAELLDGTDPFDFVYLRGGYFTPDNALSLIAEYIANKGYWKKTGESDYSQLATTDFEWENKIDNAELTWLKSYEVVAKVKDGISMYKKTGDNYVSVELDEVNSLLRGTEESHTYVAQYYKDGKCYYFVNIDQSSVAGADPHTYDGVVRNHIYDLTLNSIKGIGTPVFDPSDVIVPDKPEDEDLWFLSAHINVLAWKLVTQNVDFE